MAAVSGWDISGSEHFVLTVDVLETGKISASLTRAMLPWLEDDRPRDACGEQSLDGVVQSSRQATVAQIAEKVNDGSARKVSEQMYYSWLAADRSGCP